MAKIPELLQELGSNGERVKNLAQILCERDFCRLVLSSRLHAHDAKKVVFEPIEGARCKITSYGSKKSMTCVVSYDGLTARLEKDIPSFKQGDLFFEDCHVHIAFSTSIWKISVTKEQHTRKAVHNYEKKSVFLDGVPNATLCSLGMMTKEGRIIASMRKKVAQMNQFIESIRDLTVHLKHIGRTIKIVDAGCGKGYLTFALAAVFQEEFQLDVSVVGIDSREDVICACNATRDQLGMHNLDFQCTNVGSWKEQFDFLISLHACNTATDVALFKADQMGATCLAVAPCCQHEIAEQLSASSYPLITRHPIFLQRAAALLTDAMRCELMASRGWGIKAIEFIEAEHTQKNILIKGVRHGEQQPLGTEYMKIREGLSEGILLERLFKNKS